MCGSVASCQIKRWRSRRTSSPTVDGALLLLLLGAIAALGGVRDLAAQIPLAQMYHKSWTPRDGAPDNIDSIAGAGGFLWLATDSGLYRFDGVSFERYTPPPGSALISDQTLGMFGTNDGSLWVTYLFGGLTRIKHGSITNFTERDGLRGGNLTEAAEDKDGNVWAGGTAGLQVVRNSKVTKVGLESGLPVEPIGGITTDVEGDVWVQLHDQLLVLPYREQRFRLAAASPDRIRSCTSDQRTGIWCLRTDGPIVHFTPTRQVVLPMGGKEIIRDADIFEARDGTFWFDTAKHGIERFSAAVKAVPGLESKDMDHFGKREGLTGDYAFSHVEDPEGSIWVATTGGLDQFRTVPFTTIDLGGETVVTLPLGELGSRILLATNRLFDLTTGRPVPLTAPFNKWSRSLYEGDDGNLWIGTSDELLKYSHGQLHPQELPSLPAGSFHGIQAITEDDRHGLWISIPRHGLYRFDGADWKRLGGYDGLPEESAMCAYRDHEGRAWFGWLDGRIARVSAGHVQVFGHADGLDVGAIKVFAEARGHIWVGGDRGVAIFTGKSFRGLPLVGNQKLRGVTGLAFATDGGLWINGSDGVFRVSREAVESNDAAPSRAVAFQIFNYLDGVNGIPYPLTGLSSAWMAPNGRLYVATRTNLQWIDPLRIPRNPILPSALISAIKAGDGDNLRTDMPLRLSPNVANLQISYTASSLLIPERVKFRYRLVGYDKDWIDAGTRRQAFYSKIPPGNYTFKVIACNDSGLWNETGASIPLTVPPTFVQTIWFEVLCLVAIGCMAMMAYRLRMRQVAGQIRKSLYERLAERERIARDLHDTFFQGIQGLLLRFNTATSALPKNEPTRRILEDTLRQSDQVMLEGRQLVLDLRAMTPQQSDLPLALAEYGKRMQDDYGCAIEVAVNGSIRSLHPVACEEVLAIGKEALSNAFRHSGGQSIEAELNYEPNEFRMSIRDDGAGIDPKIFSQGHREGHWGLPGMRERAKNIGADLDIWSRTGTGTEIELRLKSDIAYTAEETGGVLGKLRRLWARDMGGSENSEYF